MTPPLLSLEDAAAVLNVGRTTIYRLVREGSLATVTIGRTRRVRPADLDRFIDAHTGYKRSSRRVA